MVTTVRPHTSHWGAFDAVVEDGALVDARPLRGDPDPSPMLDNIPAAVRSPRPHRPADGPRRLAGARSRPGRRAAAPSPSSRSTWETATELLAAELRRVYADHGPTAVYGGSYGWASAGRFHHAQSQLHRFLNCLGGYVALGQHLQQRRRRGHPARVAGGDARPAQPRHRLAASSPSTPT